MKKLLEHGDGRQEIREVSDLENFVTSALVIWDEKIDGEFPQAALQHVGYLSKVGLTLEQDPVKKTNYDAKAAEQLTKEINKTNRRNRLKAHGSANTLPQLKSLVSDLIEELGLG